MVQDQVDEADRYQDEQDQVIERGMKKRGGEDVPNGKPSAFEE